MDSGDSRGSKNTAYLNSALPEDKHGHGISELNVSTDCKLPHSHGEVEALPAAVLPGTDYSQLLRWLETPRCALNIDFFF